MTRAFARFWKEKHGCQACADIPGKHMCPKCRSRAVKQWHSYVATRVEKRLCIQCPRKPKKDEQRCRACAEANRQYCASYYHQTRKFEVQKCQHNGICVRCLKADAEPGHIRCRPCMDRYSAIRRGDIVPTKKPYKCLTLS